jgi:hypothetical protein
MFGKRLILGALCGIVTSFPCVSKLGPSDFGGLIWPMYGSL